jgi:transposase
VRQPLLSKTWLAAVGLVTGQCGGQPGRLAAMGEEEFTALIRGAVAGWGGQRAWGTISGRIFAALTDAEGVVISSRRGLLRRCAGELDDLQRVRAQLRAVEAEMVAVLAELGLTRLGDIPGLTAAGAAAILAETGDPRRYDSSSSLVKHAGLSPSDNTSGAFCGQARISRRGRPGLRLTAWRAVWPMLRFNPVMAAKYQAMTAAAAAGPGTRQATAAARACRAKARVACAASLLRWIYSLVAHGTSWDPEVAAGRKDHQAASRYREAA